MSLRLYEQNSKDLQPPLAKNSFNLLQLQKRKQKIKNKKPETPA
jgi:hypothetical protein